jgi:DNA-binding IscR family transcriptional regulator
VEDVEPFASPARKANTACPVGHCIRETLNKVFASAENAMERDLEKTTLAGVIGMIKAACPDAVKKTG